MMDETPKKPWWRKKRWWAAALALPLLLAAADLLAYGPSIYAATKGWLPGGVHNGVYAPQAPVMNSRPCRWLSKATGLDRWTAWWQVSADPDRFGPMFPEVYSDPSPLLPPPPPDRRRREDAAINRTHRTPPKPAEPSP